MPNSDFASKLNQALSTNDDQHDSTILVEPTHLSPIDLERIQQQRQREKVRNFVASYSTISSFTDLLNTHLTWSPDPDHDKRLILDSKSRELTLQIDEDYRVNIPISYQNSVNDKGRWATVHLQLRRVYTHFGKLYATYTWKQLK